MHARGSRSGACARHQLNPAPSTRDQFLAVRLPGGKKWRASSANPKHDPSSTKFQPSGKSGKGSGGGDDGEEDKIADDENADPKDRLMAQGVPEENAKTALFLFGNDYDKAHDWLKSEGLIKHKSAGAAVAGGGTAVMPSGRDADAVLEVLKAGLEKEGGEMCGAAAVNLVHSKVPGSKHFLKVRDLI
jgi:hypothetical protein